MADSNSQIQVPSAWKNKRGSTFYLDEISNSGKLTGTYINRASGFGCQNIPYPVTGWIYGTAITFTTKWQSGIESCNSLTAWTGFVNQARNEIETDWNLVYGDKIMPGKDTFSLVP